MVWGVASTSRKHHRVQLLDEALEAACRLSHRYIPARQLPDKAVSLLDTACARVAISQRNTAGGRGLPSADRGVTDGARDHRTGRGDRHLRGAAAFRGGTEARDGARAFEGARITLDGREGTG